MVWRFRLSSVPVPSTPCSDFPSPVPFPWFPERRGLPALSSRRAALAAHSFVLLPVVLSVWCCVKAEGKVAVSSHRGLAFRGILGVEQFQDRAAHSCKQDSDALLFESWQENRSFSTSSSLASSLKNIWSNYVF